MVAAQPTGSSFVSTATTPLEDILPWSISKAATVIVNDSVQSDGRFVLYQHVASLYGSSSSRDASPQSHLPRVVWISGGPLTPRLIAKTLRKMGCDKASSYSQQQATNAPTSPDGMLSTENAHCTIRCLAAEIAEQEDADNYDLSDMEAFIKKVYQQTREWAARGSSEAATDWIILDDVSTLAVLVGERLVWMLIQSLHALSRKTQNFGLLVRCMNDRDQEMYRSLVSGEDSATLSTSWVGAGGSQKNDKRLDTGTDIVPWERSLVELADVLVDVSPLLTGATKDAHGRLVFTWTEDGGVRQSSYNYCVTDNRVLGIPIRR